MSQSMIGDWAAETNTKMENSHIINSSLHSSNIMNSTIVNSDVVVDNIISAQISNSIVLSSQPRTSVSGSIVNKFCNDDLDHPLTCTDR